MIGGRRAPVDGAELQDVLDPATGERIAQVPLSGADAVDAAARAAAPAAEEWADVPVMERARLMFRLQALLERDFEDLSELVVRENGKSLDEARGEVRRGIDVVEFAAGMPTLMLGGALEQVSRGVDTELFRHPLGVVAAITPFNFPVMVPLWTAPIAVASGNAYILKPSPRTPLSAMRLAELFEEAGAPPGVFSVVHGGEEAVDAPICDHELIRAVSFVGSAPVARAVYARSAAAGKRVQALAGAKNHIVVMPDADLDLAVPGMFSPRSRMPASVVSPEPSAWPWATSATNCPSVWPGWPARPASARASTRRARSRRSRARRRESGSQVTSGWASRKERASSWTDDAGRRRLLPRPDDPRSGAAGDAGRAGGDLGPVLALERLDSLDEALAAIAGNEFGNASAIFTRSGAVARAFRRKVTARNGRNQRSRPGLDGVLPVRRLEGLVLRRSARHGNGRSALLHRDQGRHHALVIALESPRRRG